MEKIKLTKRFIKPKDVLDTLNEFDDEVFTVAFIKRSTGELRRMRAVRNYDDGTIKYRPAYNPSEKGLIIVYDIEKNTYKAVPVEGIVYIEHKDMTYVVNEELYGEVKQ